MDENLERVYNEIRKEIIKDNLKLMKDTSHEYITLAGEAFLDGLQVNGECIEIVSKDKYKELELETRQLRLNNSDLKKELSLLKKKFKPILNVTTAPKKKKFFNIFN